MGDPEGPMGGCIPRNFQNYWLQEHALPRGSIYTTIMELGPQNHNRDGLLGLIP